MIINAFIFGQTKYQWTWESDFVPEVGDTLNLWVGVPGEEADDAITTKVIARSMYAPSGATDEPMGEVDLQVVVTGDETLDGMVADSPYFPSREWPERQRQLEIDLEKIRRGEPVGGEQCVG